MARVVFNGTPGETWTNETDKVQYQLIVSWVHSCGQCIQNDRAIGPSWAIPFHRGCRCKQILVAPGKASQPFVDFMAKIEELPVPERSKVIGRSNLTLVEKGLVDWKDVVTPTRVRDFREVVARARLTVADMVKGGVREVEARRAYESVHTPAHELAARTRADLVGKILAKGVQRDELRRALAERLAGRVGIGEGPGGPGALPVKVTTPGPKPPPDLAARRAYLESLGVKPAAVAQVAPETPHEAMARRVREEVDRLKPEFAAAKKKFTDAETAFNALPVSVKYSSSGDAARQVMQKAHAEAEALADRGKRLKSWEADVKVNPNLIPALPIDERLKLYTAGDAKVKALAEMAADTGPLESRLARIVDVRAKLQQEFFAVTAGTPEHRKLVDELTRVNTDRRKVEREIARGPAPEKVAELIAPVKALKVEQASAATTVMRVVPLDPAQQPAVDAGLDYVRRVVAEAGLPEFHVAIGKVANPLKERSHCSRHGIALEGDDKPEVVVHEFGHYLEFHSGAGPSAQDFLAYRVGDEKSQRLKDLFPLAKYDADELGRKDKFDRAFDASGAYYAGKDYGRNVSEITAMGLQKLYEDPVGFARKDPEYCKFILGVLDGSLR